MIIDRNAICYRKIGRKIEPEAERRLGLRHNSVAGEDSWQRAEVLEEASFFEIPKSSAIREYTHVFIEEIERENLGIEGKLQG